MSGPDQHADLERTLANEREVLQAHFDVEAGPNSVLVAARTGLRVVEIAEGLLAELVSLRETLEATRKELREFEHVEGEPLYETAAVAVQAFAFSQHRAESLRETHERQQERIAELERAYRQACTNLATIRPDLTRDLSIGETADLYYDALLSGWGGIEGFDPGRAVPGEARPPEGGAGHQ